MPNATTPKTISGLRTALRCANQEAKNYLMGMNAYRKDYEALVAEIAEAKAAMKKENEKLQDQYIAKCGALEGADRLCSILIKVIELYQSKITL